MMEVEWSCVSGSVTCPFDLSFGYAKSPGHDHPRQKEPSKGQLKKVRKHQCRTLRKLAQLYRRKAQIALEMANLCDFEAKRHDHRPPFKVSRMPKRVMLSLNGTPRCTLEIEELAALFPELYAELKRQVDARSGDSQKA